MIVLPDPPTSDIVKYGADLSGPVAHCTDCHTPRRPDGQPVLARLGAGGFVFHGPWGASCSATLTQDPDTGIGKWADGEIIASIHGARRGGGRVLPPMPTGYYAAGIREAGVTAIIAYLRALAPVKNAVPAPAPPKQP